MSGAPDRDDARPLEAYRAERELAKVLAMRRLEAAVERLRGEQELGVGALERARRAVVELDS